MASKYAHLKGKIPEQRTERDDVLIKMVEEFKDVPLDTLTATYNTKVDEKAALAKRTKEINVSIEALGILIRDRLSALGADGVKGLHGYTWSETFEPYPVAEDPAAIVTYFEEHGMADQLKLSKTELAARLKNFVKEEALNNELDITTETVIGADGQPHEQPVVRSKIPGVKVFLSAEISRVKSGSKSA